MSELETKVARAIWACRKPMNLGEEFAEAEYRKSKRRRGLVIMSRL